MTLPTAPQAGFTPEAHKSASLQQAAGYQSGWTLFKKHIHGVGICDPVVFVIQDVIDLVAQDDLVDDDLIFLTISQHIDFRGIIVVDFYIPPHGLVKRVTAQELIPVSNDADFYILQSDGRIDIRGFVKRAIGRLDVAPAVVYLIHKKMTAAAWQQSRTNRQDNQLKIFLSHASPLRVKTETMFNHNHLRFRITIRKSYDF